jgi:hypothetical protein
MAWERCILLLKSFTQAFPVSWELSNSIMWATGYNTKPLPKSANSL